MKGKKTLLLWPLTLSLAISLAACGTSNNPTTPTTTAGATGETTTTAVTTTAEATTTPAATGETTQPTESGMVPGEYIGMGKGRNGAIVVKVNVSTDSIDGIEVIASDETYNTGSVPVETYPDLILEHQTFDLDIVSGATISSAAMLTAVKDAVKRAGGDPAQFTGEVTKTSPYADSETDVVVVGGGGAGLTAAIHAAKAGKNVIVLEKLDIVGGTSNYSIEGFGSVGDKTHAALGSDVTPEALAEMLTAGNPNGTASAFEILANNNGPAADWLRSIGAPMTVAGGQTSVATSRETGELGVSIISALKAECAKSGVEIRTGNEATDLITTDGAVTGVKVATDDGGYVLTAKSVVLATGGFGANNQLVSEHYPALEGYDSSCSVGATGDGHLMAERAGAVLDNMDYIRVNFTYTTAANGYFYYMGSLFNTGAIFVNEDGKRFVNDQGAYGVGLKVVEQGGKGWAVFDDSMVKSIEDVRKYNELGLFVKADSIEELADLIGVSKDNLLETVETYKGYVANGKDEEFNRGMLNMTFDEAPFYACPMTARVQGTFGGITINDNAEVITPTGDPIPGLFAAGECADDGTWGANPAAVNIVYGRIAGENAAVFAK